MTPFDLLSRPGFPCKKIADTWCSLMSPFSEMCFLATVDLNKSFPGLLFAST